MTHEDAGHYAAKHPKGTVLDPRIAAALKTRIQEGGVSCAAAHAAASELGVSPGDVGRAIDLMELKIAKCQLGLFGYTPEKKIVKPAQTVSPELKAAIQKQVQDDRISCKAAWDIADTLGIPRMEISAALEALSIKVTPCQIGAF
ncbi:hypothetical protein [Desulfococcus multivorans]|jgi:hypothetical protein|uniref:Uncharacterized protein n=1 Tax=Desulfococcus multivorans DSM 2059 TaxID=1121405 RepID=S7UUI7_DESML|nr:hypothetical protein [Desulfococcus multivorans]AOY58731.1 conserved uncharacterized protein [Desulfococcus multivorans]AQV01014.1 hypothetical protein B2D07_09710 [Desulfococcus multivorans]EPR37719.1 hypothetical protein dsmv_3008 [Desulfococcus multivorans DSM 2059]SJZ47185.1 hypothetical protein SAMN02745446_00652 [Desulfococcus multivorans DSM 2059]